MLAPLIVLAMLAAEPPPRYVLLPDDRPLRLDGAPADGPLLRVLPDDGVHRAVARVVADDGEELVVEVGAHGDRHCYPGVDTGGPRLRLRVARSSVAPVLTRTVDARFADGTSATLAAGLAVRPRGDAFEVLDPPFAGLPVPTDAVGAFYAFDGPLYVTANDVRVRARATLRAGGATWRVLSDDHLVGGPLSARRVGDLRGDVLVEVAPWPEAIDRQPCTRVVARAKRRDLGRWPAMGGSATSGPGTLVRFGGERRLVLGETGLPLGSASFLRVLAERSGAPGQRCFVLAGTLRRATPAGLFPLEVCLDGAPASP